VSLRPRLLSVAKVRMKSADEVNDVREAQNYREEIKGGVISRINPAPVDVETLGDEGADGVQDASCFQ